MPLPQVEGLPDNAESTADVLPDQVQILKKAFDGLERYFYEFLEQNSSKKKPDWIIFDFAHYWGPQIASKFEVPCVYFSIILASTLAFFGPLSELKGRASRTSVEELTKPPPWVPFPSTLAFRLYQAKWILGACQKNDSGISDVHRVAAVIEGCKLVAPRSCSEYESNWLQLIGELYKKPVVPIGLLPPALSEADHEFHQTATSEVFEWLDKQTPGSVLYIALGSETVPSIEQVHELALGLELSKVPFLWALRKPVSIADEERILPDGFEDRTQGCGVITMGWIHQLKVLGHASIGGFLTHCGWSSIIESMQFGHPLVMLPYFVDQGLIARAMGEKMVGLEVARNEEDGSFHREEVTKTIRLVMMGEEGKLFRCKARELKEIFADKESQERCIDDFIRQLREQK